jgi:hypothetical protein
MPYVKKCLERKASCKTTTHNTIFATNDLSHTRSCQNFTFPRANKCRTTLNYGGKKSLQPTTLRYTYEGAKSNIGMHTQYLFGAPLYTNTIPCIKWRAEGFSLVSGSHLSHSLLTTYAMNCEISASGLFGTVLVHIGVSVILSSDLLSFFSAILPTNNFHYSLQI